jgi:hypothetical protein
MAANELTGMVAPWSSDSDITYDDDLAVYAPKSTNREEPDPAARSLLLGFGLEDHFADPRDYQPGVTPSIAAETGTDASPSLVGYIADHRPTASIVPERIGLPSRSVVAMSNEQPTPSLIRQEVGSQRSTWRRKPASMVGKWPYTTFEGRRASDGEGDLIQSIIHERHRYWPIDPDRVVRDRFMSKLWYTVPLLSDGQIHAPLVRHGTTTDFDHLNFIHFERALFPSPSVASICSGVVVICGLDQLQHTRFYIECQQNFSELLYVQGDRFLDPRSFRFSVTPPSMGHYVLAALKICLAQNIIDLSETSIESSDLETWHDLNCYMSRLSFSLHDQLSCEVGEMFEKEASNDRALKYSATHESFIRDPGLRREAGQLRNRFLFGGPLMRDMR